MKTFAISPLLRVFIPSFRFFDLVDTKLELRIQTADGFKTLSEIEIKPFYTRLFFDPDSLFYYQLQRTLHRTLSDLEQGLENPISLQQLKAFIYQSDPNAKRMQILAHNSSSKDLVMEHEL